MAILERLASTQDILNGVREIKRPKVGTLRFLHEHEGTNAAVLLAHTVMTGVQGIDSRRRYEVANRYFETIEAIETVPDFMLTDLEPSHIAAAVELGQIENVTRAARLLTIARSLGYLAQPIVLCEIEYIG